MFKFVNFKKKYKIDPMVDISNFLIKNIATNLEVRHLILERFREAVSMILSILITFIIFHIVSITKCCDNILDVSSGDTPASLVWRSRFPDNLSPNAPYLMHTIHVILHTIHYAPYLMHHT